MTRSSPRARSAIVVFPPNRARESTSLMINATRAAKWSTAREKFFVTGEDLTCQAGLAVQQDLALGALIGLSPHASVTDTITSMALPTRPDMEADAFLAAHPDLYARDGDKVRLAVHDGDLLTDTLTAPGFASGTHPLWPAMSPLQQPKARTLQEQSL